MTFVDSAVKPLLYYYYLNMNSLIMHCLRLHRAFSECERTWLDKLLAVMFHQALDLQSPLTSPSLLPPSHSPSPGLHVLKSLPLSSENKVNVEFIVSRLLFNYLSVRGLQ